MASANMSIFVVALGASLFEMWALGTAYCTWALCPMLLWIGSPYKFDKVAVFKLASRFFLIAGMIGVFIAKSNFGNPELYFMAKTLLIFGCFAFIFASSKGLVLHKQELLGLISISFLSSIGFDRIAQDLSENQLVLLLVGINFIIFFQNPNISLALGALLAVVSESQFSIYVFILMFVYIFNQNRYFLILVAFSFVFSIFKFWELIIEQLESLNYWFKVFGTTDVYILDVLNALFKGRVGRVLDVGDVNLIFGAHFSEPRIEADVFDIFLCFGLPGLLLFLTCIFSFVRRIPATQRIFFALAIFPGFIFLGHGFSGFGPAALLMLNLLLFRESQYRDEQQRAETPKI
ncbi:hypothetical protein [Shewanella sp.]|uniref:hypothetical protein n=1 Tax=Shewanella sp. TaxID=50422 RepID=UPI00404818FA